MKFITYISSIIGIFSLLINDTYSKSINTTSNADKTISKRDDNYYLIYVNNTLGEINLYSNSKNQKRQESFIFVESLINEINDLIVENKDTYRNPEKLDEIEESSKLQKRNVEDEELNTFNTSDFVYPISSVKERLVLYSYLSEKLVKKVKNLNSIVDIIPQGTFSFHEYYNKEDILSETHWKNLSVRENADLHLSLISQGKYDKKKVGKYDSNYYYPSTAGKDIDIVILDSSFNFKYSEFSNTNDRIVKCAANVSDGRPSLRDIENSCGHSTIYHGESVSDTAAGLKHGAASRANVYGVSVATKGMEFSDTDLLAGLQFIYERLVRPHKTVINLSLGGMDIKNSETHKQFNSVLSAIKEKGGIIVASAGNDGKLIGLSREYIFIPCELDSVICVGGTTTSQKTSVDNVYNVDQYSNYGPPVDVYAPFYVVNEIIKENKVQKIEVPGTSFSSPLVAGLVATIMGENPEVKYTKEIILEKLRENGKSETISKSNQSGIFANNGKHIVYSSNGQYNGCGVYAGNRPCSPDDKNNSKDDSKNDSKNDSKDNSKNNDDKPIIREDGRCGPNYGNAVCRKGQCCNSSGRCGTGLFDCFFDCLPKYGDCY